MTSELTKAEEIEKAVDAILAKHNVAYSVSHVGLNKDEQGWQHDLWMCVLTAARKPLQTFEYRTGLGHRKMAESKQRLIKQYRKIMGEVEFARWLRSEEKPVKPPAAGLLHSLVLDGMSSECSFESWCSDFGYDTDSRKALSVYLACQENWGKLCKLLNHEARAELQKALENY